MIKKKKKKSSTLKRHKISGSFMDGAEMPALLCCPQKQKSMSSANTTTDAKGE